MQTIDKAGTQYSDVVGTIAADWTGPVPGENSGGREKLMNQCGIPPDDYFLVGVEVYTLGVGKPSIKVLAVRKDKVGHTGEEIAAKAEGSDHNNPFEVYAFQTNLELDDLFGCMERLNIVLKPKLLEYACFGCFGTHAAPSDDY